MLFNRLLCRLAMSVSLLGILPAVHAQSLPGTEVSETSVSQGAITLIKLAQQAYPSLFAQVTPWRSFEGFHYKYFAASGVYVGIKSNDLYLLGGSFGSAASYQGSVTNAIGVVQGSLGTSAQPFRDYVTARTLLDLIAYFKKLKINYGSSTAIGSATPTVLQSAITLDVIGPETVNGATAQRLKVTLEGSTISTPLEYHMWVNGEGSVVRLIFNGFEYATAQAQLIGPGLVSSMLLSLAAADTPTVKAVVNNQLANNAAVTQSTRDNSIGGVPVKTLTITISDTATASISLDLSDLGPLSLATKFTSSLKSLVSTSVTTFEITQVQLH